MNSISDILKLDEQIKNEHNKELLLFLLNKRHQIIPIDNIYLYYSRFIINNNEFIIKNGMIEHYHSERNTSLYTGIGGKKLLEETIAKLLNK